MKKRFSFQGKDYIATTAGENSQYPEIVYADSGERVCGYGLDGTQVSMLNVARNFVAKYGKQLPSDFNRYPSVKNGDLPSDCNTHTAVRIVIKIISILENRGITFC